MKEITVLATEQIGEINRGLLDEELGMAIKEVTAAVLRHGKKGTVTMKLEISAHNFDMGSVKILHDVKAVLPKEKREGGILFATPSGKLTPNDPAQISLELKTVAADEPKLKVAK